MFMRVAHVSRVVTTAQILEGLRGLGVRPGALVVAHASLGRFGWVQGGEDAVIDALISAVGSTGTVCMPALSYGRYGPHRPPPPFDPAVTESVVGRISERFRQRDGVIRSLHPTHSVAACGARAEELLRHHDRAQTPCGRDSPWGRIADAGGSVVMVGVGTRFCTMFHGPEEEAEPELRCTPPTRCRIRTGSEEWTVSLRLHKPYRGAVSNRAAMAEVLRAEGLLRQVRVGETSLLCIDARGLWELSLRLLRARPSTRFDQLHAWARLGANVALSPVLSRSERVRRLLQPDASL